MGVTERGMWRMYFFPICLLCLFQASNSVSSFSWYEQGWGSKEVELTPADMCHNECSSVLVTLHAGDIRECHSELVSTSIWICTVPVSFTGVSTYTRLFRVLHLKGKQSEDGSWPENILASNRAQPCWSFFLLSFFADCCTQNNSTQGRVFCNFKTASFVKQVRTSSEKLLCVLQVIPFLLIGPVILVCIRFSFKFYSVKI